VIFCNMGELFIDLRIFEKISYVLAAWLELVVQTNALLPTPERVDALIATGFDGYIYISCHGIAPAVYRGVMGLDIAKVLPNVEYRVQHYPPRAHTDPCYRLRVAFRRGVEGKTPLERAQHSC